MLLDQIGFYTLSEYRAINTFGYAPLARCELIITSRCNFRCPYCRNVGGQDIDYQDAMKIIEYWASKNLTAIRFSGGEPTLHPNLRDFCWTARKSGIARVAISTNGSANFDYYNELILNGVNDFSVSLDACCAKDNFAMTGVMKDYWEKVTSNIRELSKLTYVTVGVVLNENNVNKTLEIIRTAHELGVADIRVIPAAQYNSKLQELEVPEYILQHKPILRYRYNNIKKGQSVRSLTKNDTNKCYLVLDDMAICDGSHYPCIIYMREHGKPIARFTAGDALRINRYSWFRSHNTHTDPICRENCLDVCRDYNNKAFNYHKDVDKNVDKNGSFT